MIKLHEEAALIAEDVGLDHQCIGDSRFLNLHCGGKLLERPGLAYILQ
jgi:hypothetical protein